MNEHRLDEDLSRWPDNAFELLGVSHGVLPRELRRAYTRLIRIYKPEQFPEHFRRIRAAFEQVLRFAELFGHSAEPETMGPPVPSPAALKAHEPSANLPPVLRPEDAEREFWELACQGEVERAYDGFLCLNREQPGRTEVLVRLYWLLELYRELDTQRSPRDWLLEALRASGLTGPARELYRREIDADPGEGVSERCRQLLECRTCSARQLADLALWRLQAASRLGRWHIIEEDLERLRARLAFDEKEAWLTVLLAAADSLAWNSEPAATELFEQCRKEIADVVSAGSARDTRLDRFDLLSDLTRGWRALAGATGLAEELTRLIPSSWNRPFAEVRPALVVFLEHVVRDPSKALMAFDRILHRARAVLTQFGSLLQELQRWDHASQALTPGQEWLAAEFLDGSHWPDIASFRKQLLAFCVRDSLDPERVALVALSLPKLERSAAKLVDQVRGDWSLRYVCEAHRVFWA